jgi:hypothetical protein
VFRCSCPPTEPGAKWGRPRSGSGTCCGRRPRCSSPTASGHPRSAACWRHCDGCSITACSGSTRATAWPCSAGPDGGAPSAFPSTFPSWRWWGLTASMSARCSRCSPVTGTSSCWHSARTRSGCWREPATGWRRSTYRGPTRGSGCPPGQGGPKAATAVCRHPQRGGRRWHLLRSRAPKRGASGANPAILPEGGSRAS